MSMSTYLYLSTLSPNFNFWDFVTFPVDLAFGGKRKPMLTENKGLRASERRGVSFSDS